MSILLIGVSDDLATALVPRLARQGDEVRILEVDRSREDRWRELGAYVAVGPMDDWDLIERAATNVRTLVLGPNLTAPLSTTISEILRGAEKADVGRVVVVAPSPAPEIVDALSAGSFDYVVLTSGTRGVLRRGWGVAPASLAEAVDAADDLAGDPKLLLDLKDPRAWAALRLERPEERGD